MKDDPRRLYFHLFSVDYNCSSVQINMITLVKNAVPSSSCSRVATGVEL